MYQTTLYPGVLLDAASDLKLLASERWERKRYRDLLGGQFLQLRLFEKQPISTLACELIAETKLGNAKRQSSVSCQLKCKAPSLANCFFCG